MKDSPEIQSSQDQQNPNTVSDTMASSVADPRVGTTIAGYRIERLLGRGGMGTVYLAEDIALERRVALKLLSTELSDDAAFRDRFRVESRLAASIDHPNVIPIHDAGQADDGTLFISMRYVEGADLKQLLKERGSLPADDAVHLLAQVARGLDAAHARGLVHRDVKPSNVLVASSEGESDHVYLADFGLTKTPMSEDDARDSITLSGSSDYASPEQIRGTHADKSSDVYALGCVAYECLTSEVPFPRQRELEVLFAHLNDEPPLPSGVDPNLPGGLDAVVARAMAKEPTERYASGTALVDAIAEATAPRRRLGRRRFAILAALLAIVAAAIAVPSILFTGGERGGPTITTVAGVGLPGSTGDGGLATNAQVFPVDVRFAPDGTLYITDQPGRVRRINQSGFIQAVAGTGRPGNSGDGGPAASAEIGVYPTLAFGPDGTLYLMEYDQAVVRRVTPDGVISTVDVAPCRNPSNGAVDATGALYISCAAPNVIQRVEPDGTVTVIAGTGLPGFAGDGGPATEAELDSPSGITLAPDGSVFVLDIGNDRIRRVDPDGVITTIAGTDSRGFSGDGGPAIEAELDMSYTGGIVLDSEGTLFFADINNERVRRIGADGVISTVVGSGTRGYGGDGGDPKLAELNDVQSMTIDVDGNLYLADSQNYRVRKVSFNP